MNPIDWITSWDGNPIRVGLHPYLLQPQKLTNLGVVLNRSMFFNEENGFNNETCCQKWSVEDIGQSTASGTLEIFVGGSYSPCSKTAWW
jgi:hypothetical protein